MLYAECLLSLYYVVMSVYGWYYWIKKRHLPAVKVELCQPAGMDNNLVHCFCGWGILYLVLVNFTPSTVPIWDAWVSSTAWAGMWLLARRKIENWVLLNVSNLFAIPFAVTTKTWRCLPAHPHFIYRCRVWLFRLAEDHY
jgi:nicotinamide mononucleotide transporter